MGFFYMKYSIPTPADDTSTRSVDRPTTTLHGMLLSLFPCADLLGTGFTLEGFSVVRGPEKILGQRIEDFHVLAGRFDGVIGGSPCQDFSRARRCPPTGNGLLMIEHFRRVVTEAEPEWWLLENVTTVPDVAIEGFKVQRFNLRAQEFGLWQNRNRCFQFGYRVGPPLIIDRPGVGDTRLERCAMATEGGKRHRRPWATFIELQGLPAGFDLPGWSVKAKYAAVGNGVPIPMLRAVAIAIRRRLVTPAVPLCVCECGRRVTGNATHATAACRKRMERRRRVTTSVTRPGFDTPASSP